MIRPITPTPAIRPPEPRIVLPTRLSSTNIPRIPVALPRLGSSGVTSAGRLAVPATSIQVAGYRFAFEEGFTSPSRSIQISAKRFSETTLATDVQGYIAGSFYSKSRSGPILRLNMAINAEAGIARADVGSILEALFTGQTKDNNLGLNPVDPELAVIKVDVDIPVTEENRAKFEQLSSSCRAAREALYFLDTRVLEKKGYNFSKFEMRIKGLVIENGVCLKGLMENVSALREDIERLEERFYRNEPGLIDDEHIPNLKGLFDAQLNGIVARLDRRFKMPSLEARLPEELEVLWFQLAKFRPDMRWAYARSGELVDMFDHLKSKDMLDERIIELREECEAYYRYICSVMRELRLLPSEPPSSVHTSYPTEIMLEDSPDGKFSERNSKRNAIFDKDLNGPGSMPKRHLTVPRILARNEWNDAPAID